MFASAGSVLKLHKWSDNQLQQTSTYKPKSKSNTERKIINVSWCHDNSYIALLQQGNQPQIVSSKDRTNVNLVHTINALKYTTAICFKNHTKRNLVLGNKSGEVLLYDTKNRSITNKVASLPDAVKLLEFNCRDEQLAISSESTLSVFSDHEGVNNFVKEFHQSEICTVVKFHPSLFNIMAVGGEHGGVTIWDTEKEEKISVYQKHSSSVTGIGFTSNQKLIITTGMDNKICIIDNSSAECLFRTNIHQAITAVDVSPDDIYVAAGLEDGCIYIYDIREPLKPLICTNVHNCPINKIAFEKGPILTESLHEGNSFTTLNESEFGDNNQYEAVNLKTEESFEDSLKKDLIKTVKNHMVYLENQLAEHCSKFQSFIDNEFDLIHNAMARWDVFNIGDTSEIIHAIDATEKSKSVKSTSIH